MSKRIVILGGGESGSGAAVLALKKGFDVFVSDKGRIGEQHKEVLQNHSIAFEEQQHTEAIRRQTHTGRPCGARVFVDQLEALLGRALHPQKRGPKKKDEAETGASLFSSLSL